ncbi:hypothetical protein, partial [Acinetobacter baumannii]|uniref:hypothetical protein n=1 Tax=Acinetobacter baumannii TaxID=470 RepID=UPI00289C9908
MLLSMPHLRSLALLVPLIVCGGMAWSTTVSTVPPNLRKAIHTYLTLLLDSCFAGAGFTLHFTCKVSAFPSTGCDGGTHRHISQVDCRVHVAIMQ